jgi:hypothetical protein
MLDHERYPRSVDRIKPPKHIQLPAGRRANKTPRGHLHPAARVAYGIA